MVAVAVIRQENLVGQHGFAADVDSSGRHDMNMVADVGPCLDPDLGHKPLIEILGHGKEPTPPGDADLRADVDILRIDDFQRILQNGRRVGTAESLFPQIDLGEVPESGQLAKQTAEVGTKETF